MAKKPIRQKSAGHARKAAVTRRHPSASEPYRGLVDGIKELLENARCTSARTVNAIMTATYWEIGRRIVEYEQGGKVRAEYGEALLETLAHDLTERFGRGFSYPNLNKFRQFYLAFPQSEILSTLSIESHSSTEKPPREARRRSATKARGDWSLHTSSAESDLAGAATRFPLPWSAYVRLLAVKNDHARRFYETEALRGGWSVRQLGRQIDAQFYERTALSRSKGAILKKSALARPDDSVSAEEEVKDPYVLEFLGLRDEYSETDLEQALIRHLESFLLELGGDFCFVGRQKRLRIGDEWFRVDLVFYHRRLRCLMLIDLKLGRFTHADAGQMHTYLNYALEHWTRQDENPPVGLILCAQRDEALARYALGSLPNKVLAAEYRTVLPDETLVASEVEKTRRMLEGREGIKSTSGG